MGGGDADAGAGAVVADGPAQSGGGLQPGVQVSGDAVGGNDPGGFQSEAVGLDAAVVADGDGLGQVGALQVIAQTLGGPADHIHIQTVGAGADNTAQTAGAEFQVPVKPVENGLLVGYGVQGAQFVLQVGIIHGPLQPQIVQGKSIHSLPPI